MANYFRNTDFVEVDGQTIEPQSLWEKQEDTMVLVDDDQYITAPDNGQFTPVT